MRLKIALLCAALVGLGNVRAGVVGISPTTVPLTGSTAAGSQNFTFKTTGLGGSKLTGIGLYGFTNAASTSNLIISLTYDSTTVTRTFGVGLNTAGVENEFDSSLSLVAGKTYTVEITEFRNLSFGAFRQIGATNGYNAPVSGISDYWADPLNTGAGNMAISLFYDSTSVPEPATMILTGSALAAGAIGAYFKRRRKPQTEIAA